MSKSTHHGSKRARGLFASVAAALLVMVSGSASSADIVTQLPLSIRGNVPGNLLLVPSVEWPTLDSMANLGSYSTATTYVGYFDSAKCYKYSYSATETDRYFYPVAKTTTQTCNNSDKQWSGNYLNWAATQTIDPFRKALTGGYRVKDTTTTTWLEKARYDGNGANSIYPNRRLPASNTDSTLVKGATPTGWDSMTIRIWQLGNKMRFTGSGDLNTTTPVIYDPATHTTPDSTKVYELSVRVKVCDASIGVEANCKQYSEGWKPEGLIQQYAARLRYSVFGYLNDGNMLRDGGVLRAKQKFVGQTAIDPKTGTITNPNPEWDATTGVVTRNPDSADATATTTAVGATIADSGVINYINKFGQMTTQNHKSYDPVSELYYAAIRYLKSQGNVPAYTSLSGTSTQRYNLADGFPVISTWDDPIQYWCQNNAILGIGDANSHRDKNLPGNGVMTDEPSTPSEVSGDTTVNVATALQKVAELEGITINTPFTGRENSAYIAALAYDSHTVDMRKDLKDNQTVSTYWVDVRENQVLEKRARNQYWLAAKYGGFTVPEGYEPYKQTKALDLLSWATNETLSNGDLRPENFYVASEASKMVESLTRAFAKISAETEGSAASLAANSTRLEADTKTFQAQFVSGTWRGELKAFAIDNKGVLSTTPKWLAGAQLTALGTNWVNRKIYVNNPQGGASAYTTFEWSNLGSTQTAALVSQDVVDYLRGDRSKEQSQKDGTLRTRTSVLGDIVNSTPVFVGKPNPRLYAGATFSGASVYSTFATAKKDRTQVVYVGANDGMLHGFDAETGAETYAFVPNAVILNGLKQFSEPLYQHKYFVDGELAISDVYDTKGKVWKTVLVGTLGRGGPGVFALDVTDPSAVKFLWEKRGTDIAALGRNIGKPVIAQVDDGDWRVLIGNGPDTSTGSAQLVSIGVLDGGVTVANTAATGSNGLSAVLARDTDGDWFADVAYAGDLLGNLWKFSGLDSGTSISKLFEARDPSNARQPITAAPLVGKDPATGKTWVFVGTGRYLHSDDLKNKQVQTWYGLKDEGVAISGRGALVQRKITSEGAMSGLLVRVVEEGTTAQLTTQKGWYMDLLSPDKIPTGERMVIPNRFQGQALIGTTRIPDATDVCRPAGKGFVMAINPFTGAALAKTFFDVNGDNIFNDGDKLGGSGGSIVSGIGTESSPSNPLFVGDMMHIGLDDGTTTSRRVQGADVQATRMSWRELLNQ